MKKQYMTPEAEKIEFDYRDQVVAASTIQFGQFYNEDDWANGCKIFLAEAGSVAFCNLFSLE